MTRVAVLRALPGLGDLLCAVPALRALRALGDAHVTLIGLPGNAALLERLPGLVDELVPFPGWPGLPEVPFDEARTEAFLGGFVCDVALQLHGSGEQSGGFVRALRASRHVGPGVDAPPGWPEDLHEIRRCLSVVERAGFAPRGEAVRLTLTADDEAEAAALRPPAPYAVVHPGANEAARRWSLARFGAACDELGDRGLVPLLTGTAAEAEANRRVREYASGPVVDLAGRTSLGALAALLRDATVTVTNDTGTSHLAAAVGAPSVVVFLVTDPARWAPLDTVRHRALVRPGVGDVLRAVDELGELELGAAVHDDVEPG